MSNIVKDEQVSTSHLSTSIDNVTFLDNTIFGTTPDNLAKDISNFLKRTFDILFSLVVLVILSPVYCLIALTIKIISPAGSVFFAHKRIGLNNKNFNCYKFRTMVPDAEKILDKWLDENPEIKEEFQKDFKLKHDPRIIPVIGSFLRKTSLDELPQFFNVLKGEMSVVGPRPIIDAEKVKYGNMINYLLSVKPGITGLWQVSGRNDVDYLKRISLDTEYIEKQNFLMDLKIIFRTIFVMLAKDGAY